MKNLFVKLLLLTYIISFLVLPASAAGDASATPDYDGYIVKIASGSSDSVRLMSDDGAEEISRSAGLYLVETPAEVMALVEGGNVEYFEPNYMFELLDTANDVFYPEQWNLAKINASAAWDAGLTGSGIRVAVIDSGINASHPDFAGTSIATGYNVIDGSADVTDTLGHGTRVSSIIAATTNNEIGIAGITSGATIVPIKCFTSSKETSASYIIKAIYAAVDDLDCGIINLSLGIDVDMATFKSCINYAVSQGTIIVSAVGNNGDSGEMYPAAYDNVIGVGSIGADGTVSSFSNRNSSVFVTAPGEKILSLSLSDNKYSSGSGTSYAVPHVTALAVVARSYDADMTVDEFEAFLAESAADAGDPGYDIDYGYGVIDIAAFIKAMQASGGGDDEQETMPFTDVSNHWGKAAIEYAYKNNLFNGITATTFEPDGTMNRAMAVTVLNRLSGDATPAYSAMFTDVAEKDWFASSVMWGANIGVVKGNGNGTFTPLASVTREQMASFLYRYAVTYGLTAGETNESTLSGFADGDSVSSWSRTEMAWAVENGLFSGRSGNKLEPGSTITRAEVATVVMRFAEKFNIG